MTALRTGEHILRWITPARERKTSRSLRAECSCGQRWRGVPDEQAVRLLHERHVEQIQTECSDHWHCEPLIAAHDCSKPDRSKPCPSCGEVQP